MASKRPAYQWYPGDAKRDTALQACCFEARALWREMMDIMHDGEPYGHLTAGGVPITAEQLARMVGVAPKRVQEWLDELEQRNVFSRTEAGVIYSRRMVRDEENRTKRAAGGSKGGNPALLKDRNKVAGKVGSEDNHEVNLATNLPANHEITPASASAFAVKEKQEKEKSAHADQNSKSNSELEPVSRVIPLVMKGTRFEQA